MTPKRLADILKAAHVAGPTETRSWARGLLASLVYYEGPAPIGRLTDAELDYFNELRGALCEWPADVE